MPFVKRTIKSLQLKKHARRGRALFEDFSDVSNYTLAGAIVQLASLCGHAEDIFGELDEEIRHVQSRCLDVSRKIKSLQVRIERLDAKNVLVPVSDLDVEKGLPLYLHYQSPNSIEEDLFTRDTRTPCLIHLHQRARQDLNYILRGSEAYTKQGRPRSFDPKLLMDEFNEDPYSPASNRNSSFFSSSAHISAKAKNDNSILTHAQRLQLESSNSQVDIITVDTSGEKFDRQANLRRSHRLSSCSVRQRSNLTQRRQLRHRHKTLTGLPGNISAEIGDPRPYSLHSDANNSTGHGTGSFVEGSSDESRSMINGHVIVSPRQNQRNAEIQTDEVKVIPLTPVQRRMRMKGISPTSSHVSTEFLESPTAVPCPTVPQINHTSTPINGAHEKEMIRPTSLDVANNDTSTDEGRHTGESNPPTPARSGTPQSLSASPHMKASPSSPMATKLNKYQQNGHGKEGDIAMRANGARLQQGEDRTSSGFWSGTESTRHSSTSDITMHHALVTNALQQERRGSPKFSNSAGQISPIVDNRPWTTPSAVSSSSVSINSKLSTIDLTRSTTSIRDDDDDYFKSANSSVISVTLTRSGHNSSNMSINSTPEGGKALSAAEILKKSRKSRNNPSAGAYNFMNYDVDPLENESGSISRAIKNRRSARSSKHRLGSKKRLNAEDTISVTSMADSSSRLTDVDGNSGNDTASLSGSIFSVDQEGYYTSMHEDCGISKTISPATSSAHSIAESLTPDTAVPDIPTPIPVVVSSPVNQPKDQLFFGEKFQKNEEKNSSYNSYNRAVKSNHSTPKSLLSPRAKSASVKTPKSAEAPALDFQSELTKRLSLRRTASSSGNKKSPFKEKRGAAPPPPKRGSSLSNSTSPSPSLSHRSLSEKASSPASPCLSTRSSPGKISPASPPLEGTQEKPTTPTVVKDTPVDSKSPEMTYMETLPPPPTPDQLQEIEKTVQSPKVTRDKSQKRPPPPPKPQRTSFIGGKRAPETKPKPTVHVVGESKDLSPVSPVRVDPKAKQPPVLENANGKPYYSTATDVTVMNVLADVTLSKEETKENFHPNKQEVVSHSIISDASALQNKEKDEKTIVVSDVTKVHVTDSSTVAEAKSPPAVLPKTTSVKPPVTNTPPVVSPKPAVSITKSNDVTNASFDEKRTREQSPSYRASIARAAFFAPVKAPVGGKEGKLAKVPLVEPKHDVAESTAATQEGVVEDKTPSSVKKVEVIPTEESTSKTDESKKDDVTDKDAEKSHPKDESITEEPVQTEKEENVGTPDSNDWLEKIEEFSIPNRAPASPDATPKDQPEAAANDSAAARLQLSVNVAKESSKSTPKYSTYENLMAAIHRSKREALTGKPGASPPSSPGTNNEVFSYRAGGTVASPGDNKSPVSTLERKRNGRLSSNGSRNGISRKSTGGTSRDDFKALLLQNACRGTNGSQMTAAEKLKLQKPQANTSSLPRQRPHSFAGASSLTNGKALTEEPAPHGDEEKPPDTPRPMLSLSDIRSAITSGSSSRQGRSNRRGNRSTTMELGAKKCATLSVHGKKHPPPSLSSKYNTRSRTPTRPMMSISEDSETEKSPEQAQSQVRMIER